MTTIQRTTARRAISLVLAGAVGAAVVGGGVAAASTTRSPIHQPIHRPAGSVVAVKELGHWSVGRTRDYLEAAKFDLRSVRFGVDLEQVTYATVDERGRPTTASGLLARPDGGRRRLPLVSYTHGTTSYRPDVPSTLQDDTMSAPGIAYAAAGFASASPDYLGLGAGPGRHPWMDISSETTASLDLLTAARSVAARHGRPLSGRVYISGFSQGASAALGMARALQRGADPTERVAAVAPLSGAYSFGRAELPAVLTGNELNKKFGVAYLSYLLVARNRLYHFYDSPREIFAPPYADHVEHLFDGTVAGPQMLDALPDTVDGLLTAPGRAMVDHPHGRFRAALAEIDGVCRGWRPAAPTRLFYAPGDEQASTTNTAVCARLFHHAVPTVALPAYDYDGSRHVGTVITGVAASLRWFAQLDRR